MNINIHHPQPVPTHLWGTNLTNASLSLQPVNPYAGARNQSTHHQQMLPKQNWRTEWSQVRHIASMIMRSPLLHTYSLLSVSLSVGYREKMLWFSLYFVLLVIPFTLPSYLFAPFLSMQTITHHFWHICLLIFICTLFFNYLSHPSFAYVYI